MRNLKIVLIGLVIYIISTYFSYSVLSAGIFPKWGKTQVVRTTEETKTNGEKGVSFDDKLPKTEPCPLNGVMYSTKQRDWWGKHSPLGIMIENHQEARPQSGLSSSDIIYEAVAEGAITRFLAVFYCQDARFVGPVRSARTYFLDFISEYGNNPLYAHVGGANTPGPADALSQIEKYGWGSYNDLNQFSIGFPVFWRDYERIGHPVATEHTMYSSTSKLWDYAATRGLTNVDKKGKSWDTSFAQYQFKDDQTVSKRPDSQTLSFDYWEDYKDYSVKWQYNKQDNIYLRFNGGAAHLDKNNSKQLTAKNVVILFMTERHANDGYENNDHLLYGTKGSGRAIVFRDGEQIKGTWSKLTRTSKTIIKDVSGNEFQFDRGRIWFHILPVGNEVTVK